MRILFLGDVVGKAGRKIIKKEISKLKSNLNLDIIIINVENAAHGFGLTPKIYEEFKEMGVDIMTLGNHSFDKKDIFPILQEKSDIIRPMNYPPSTIGNGFCIKELSDGRKICVIQLIGNLFMRSSEPCFNTLTNFLKNYQIGKDFNAIVVDIHAEATSEKMALGFYFDGQVSLVAGTHTHIPTADCMILPKGTGYITDLGMCGDYWSVIGMTPPAAINRFTKEKENIPLTVAEKSATLCGVFIETDDITGMCQKIKAIRIGEHLENTKG